MPPSVVWYIIFSLSDFLNLNGFKLTEFFFFDGIGSVLEECKQPLIKMLLPLKYIHTFFLSKHEERLHSDNPSYLFRVSLIVFCSRWSGRHKQADL